jgi:hypothetical protein
MQVVSRRSAKAIGALLMLLAGSSCTLVEGRDMGPKFEHVLLTNDGTAVTNASVSVNGTTANLGADSKYHATLPSTVPVGGRLFVDVGSGPFAIHGLGRVPEAPVITAPADGASFAPAQPIPVTWTSATNPELSGQCRVLVRTELFHQQALRRDRCRPIIDDSGGRSAD